jgi:hypothetical protein
MLLLRRSAPVAARSIPMGRPHRYRRRIPPPPPLPEDVEMTAESIDAALNFLQWMAEYPEVLPAELRPKIGQLLEQGATMHALLAEAERAEQELARIDARCEQLQRSYDTLLIEAQARSLGLGGDTKPVRHLADDPPDA